jgi:hypothetical protein
VVSEAAGGVAGRVAPVGSGARTRGAASVEPPDGLSGDGALPRRERRADDCADEADERGPEEVERLPGPRLVDAMPR